MILALAVCFAWCGVCLLIPGTTVNLIVTALLSLAIGSWAVLRVARQKVR